MHWEDEKDLVPRGFLNVDVRKAQHRQFNPTFKNVFTGFIIYDVNREGANKKLYRRRHDIIEGNITSYPRCLNISKRMKAMKDHHELAIEVANISAEQVQDKANHKKEASNKAKAK